MGTCTYIVDEDSGGHVILHFLCYMSSIQYIRTSSFLVSRFGVSTYPVDSCVFIAS